MGDAASKAAPGPIANTGGGPAVPIIPLLTGAESEHLSVTDTQSRRRMPEERRSTRHLSESCASGAHPRRDPRPSTRDPGRNPRLATRDPRPGTRDATRDASDHGTASQVCPAILQPPRMSGRGPQSRRSAIALPGRIGRPVRRSSDQTMATRRTVGGATREMSIKKAPEPRGLFSWAPPLERPSRAGARDGSP